mmetsp:Transcript_3220/g.7641  ORF Transcript_3220/g.7641 Transcript_3220/m.7641 type:complete len:216 (-) Transcript_3220:475-1122(-)
MWWPPKRRRGWWKVSRWSFSIAQWPVSLFGKARIGDVIHKRVISISAIPFWPKMQWWRTLLRVMTVAKPVTISVSGNRFPKWWFSCSRYIPIKLRRGRTTKRGVSMTQGRSIGRPGSVVWPMGAVLHVIVCKRTAATKIPWLGTAVRSPRRLSFDHAVSIRSGWPRRSRTSRGRTPKVSVWVCALAKGFIRLVFRSWWQRRLVKIVVVAKVSPVV